MSEVITCPAKCFDIAIQKNPCISKDHASDGVSVGLRPTRNETGGCPLFFALWAKGGGNFDLLTGVSRE
jgi:hypothetical protein